MSNEIDEDYKAIFEKYDKDKSGYLDRDEIIAVITEYKGRKPTSKQVDRLLSKIDENNDGKISYEEFKKTLAEIRTTKQMEIAQCFQQFDTNNNGTIDKEELKNIFKMTNENIDDMSVDILWDTYDKNHDGKIDFSEFLFIYKDLGI